MINTLPTAPRPPERAQKCMYSCSMYSLGLTEVLSEEVLT